MKTIFSRLGHVISCAWFYTIGHLMLFLYYDKKYFTGPYFREGKYHGVGAQGWRWATCDGAARMFMHANKGIPWPVSRKMTVLNPENIEFDPADLHIFHTYGTYFQAVDGKIIVGRGTWIAPNVGLINANHDKNDLKKHLPGKDIVIGENSWIGMNSVILGGVVLGPNTTVGAGAVVTKSFPNGHCTIGGVPAKVISEHQAN